MPPTDELEQQRASALAQQQQQARLTEAAAEEAEKAQQETKRASLPIKQDPTEEIIKIAKQIPIVGQFVHTVPVLIWLISIFGKALWAIVLAIALWFPAVFLSVVGLPRLPIPFISLFIKAEIPKTNTVEFLLSLLYFICLFAPFFLIGAAIVGAVKWANDNKAEAIYSMLFGPLKVIAHLLP